MEFSNYGKYLTERHKDVESRTRLENSRLQPSRDCFIFYSHNQVSSLVEVNWIYISLNILISLSECLTKILLLKPPDSIVPSSSKIGPQDFLQIFH